MNELTITPFTTHNLTGVAPLVLICDHASNYIPEGLNNLGLTEDQINQHIGWDIGAAAITREMAVILDAPAILSGTSRLVIDANRPPDDPTGIPIVSDAVQVPGNQNLRDNDRQQRLDKYFWPYHQAVTNAIAKQNKRASPITPAIFSVHTFTPFMANGSERPWHAGVLWNKDPRIALPLIQQLRDQPRGFVIGNNEPYSGEEVYYSVDYHAGSAGLPHCAIEIRQDLAATQEDCIFWAKTISNILTVILADKDILQIKHFY